MRGQELHPDVVERITELLNPTLPCKVVLPMARHLFTRRVESSGT